ncbi:MAG: hypothetical protein WBL44_03360, partial [Nitrososphaeraceae archaeon]
ILHIIHRIQKEARTVLQNHTFQSKYEQLSYQEYVRELFLIGLVVGRMNPIGHVHVNVIQNSERGLCYSD